MAGVEAGHLDGARTVQVNRALPPTNRCLNALRSAMRRPPTGDEPLEPDLPEPSVNTGCRSSRSWERRSQILRRYVRAAENVRSEDP